MLHIYCGSGKGKTTAALGLALRAAGSGMRVLFVQFLKGSDTAELASLARIPEITVLRCDRDYGFTFRMNEAEKAALTACHAAGQAGGECAGAKIHPLCMTSPSCGSSTLILFPRTRRSRVQLPGAAHEPSPAAAEWKRREVQLLRGPVVTVWWYLDVCSENAGRGRDSPRASRKGERLNAGRAPARR